MPTYPSEWSPIGRGVTDANGRISVYEPVAGHPAYHAAGKARRRLLTNVAERQRQTLGDPRLAECTLATRLDGSAFTAAMWELGSVALLPKVDFAGLAEPGERPFFVPWAVLAEADLLVKTAQANGTEQVNRALEGSGSAKLLRLRRGLAVLEGIKGPIYISEDPTDLGKLGNPK